MKWSVAALLSLAVVQPALADFAADEFPPYERCALCHGLFGVSHIAKFPHLGGQSPDYLEAQIRAFLEGARENDGGQMVAIVTELKPEEIPVVVEWFSSQDPPEPVADGANDEGAALFADLGCIGCHTNSTEREPGVPFLAAQHAGYLAKQIADFRDGRRTGKVGELHASILALEDAAIEAIAGYLASETRP